jgi:hypothetical protein
MTWYEIEYINSKGTTSITGTYKTDLEALLILDNLPRFLKIENYSYYSELTNKYELYSNWDSKSSNEIIINTLNIITVKRLNGNLLSDKIKGEINSYFKSDPLNIIISTDFYKENTARIQNELLPKLKEISKLDHQLRYNNLSFKINDLKIIPNNQVIIISFGEYIIKRESKSDLISDILIWFSEYCNRFNNLDKDLKENE